jgi:hypothetical protein
MRALAVSPDGKDLAFVGGQLVELDGPDKLQQDLRLFLVEQLDMDPYTKGIGSNLMKLIPDLGGYNRDQIDAFVQVETIDAIRRYHVMQMDGLNKMRRRPWQTDAAFMAQYSTMRAQLIAEVESIFTQWDQVDPRRVQISVSVKTEAQTNVTVDGVVLNIS